jgi:hypothetical protein
MYINDLPESKLTSKKIEAEQFKSEYIFCLSQETTKHLLWEKEDINS